MTAGAVNNPSQLTNVDGTLFFSANDGQSGYELWALPVSTPTLICAGDCNHDGVVTVDELLIGIEIALGDAQLDACPPFDLNRDGSVTIDEILSAVEAALNGCK